MGKENILEIRDLSVVYKSKGLDLPVLRNINLSIKQGQIYGLAGESGSGKSTLGLSVMCHLPPEGQVTSGEITFFSQNMLTFTKMDLQGIWGKEISYIPQDSYTSLNPSMEIGRQLMEGFQAHSNLNKKFAKDRTDAWLRRIHLSNPDLISRKYPHELSGGQKQRILAAMAFLNHPRLLVLDEPTTNLDVTTEVVMLELLRDLIREEKTSALFITHNFGIINKLTDRVAVLYAGELVEDAPTQDLMQNPIHPYTQGLIKSIPKLGMFKDEDTLVDIQGQIPSLYEPPNGCVFASRCQLALNLCHQEHPPLESINEERKVRCFRWHEIQAGEINISSTEKPVRLSSKNETGLLLKVKNLEVKYPIRSTGFPSILKQKQELLAVNQVNFQLGIGKTLGIVGESGSGKSSLALALMGLKNSISGQIDLLEIQLPLYISKRNKETFRKMQMIFQSQDDSLSPYLTVEEILARPLRNLQGLNKGKALERIMELMELVHIPAHYINKYPHQLSGGEKQRVAIALAFAVNPELIIADEPVSSLDVSVQASIINLLVDIQRKYHTSSVFITHNIAVAIYMADDLLVMYHGQVMQSGKSNRIISPPYHPYTELLLSSFTENNFSKPFPKSLDEVTPPEILDFQTGCPFSSRCPVSLGKQCEEEMPPRQETGEGGMIFCHIPISKLQIEQVDLVKENG